ncbi:MAG: lipoprotein [Steroidobacteraceae bacterium]
MPRPVLLLIASTLTLLIAACGLKGNLYLPEKNAPVVISTSGQSSSSSSADSSASSTQP